ncbi:hypothetical protein SLEP1_g5741 [Rubroshorea leprosula]|uniref:glucan endo-1,3-beta-D-glucosidase n=2 Tax=Rubroshorea leprosula TaxID=152421 RepID=A0AAV5I0X6_9ROSI|nr:hypothetical protein SLEP1_g5741 [Rubroshorea leprosula]
MHLQNLLLLFTTVLHLFTSTAALGVNYGAMADNLPSPAQVANFIKTQTIFDSVKLFDTNPDFLRAFANTGISVTVTIANGDIPALADTLSARRWVASNIKPFYPQTNIKYICVGNEVLFSNNQDLINNLIPAMRSLNNALVRDGFQKIKVTTAHALNIFQSRVIPSLARFRADHAQTFFLPLLQFHRETKTPFMINPYPYFEVKQKSLSFALYKLHRGVIDKHSGKLYTNMLDQLLDSTYSAMNAFGYGDVDIVIGEAGWPSQGDANDPFATMDNAISYNGNMIREILAGKGTPLMPNRRFETYIFALFNENLKPGPVAEKNWGLFWPNFAPVYNASVMRNGSQPAPTPAVPTGKQFCVPKLGVSDGQLQSNLDYACGNGVDCLPINLGGACFEPNNLRAHASFAMNSYYRTKGQTFNECNFGGTGQLTTVDPSYGNCHFL